jgi:hypothetical protein
VCPESAAHPTRNVRNLLILHKPTVCFRAGFIRGKLLISRSIRRKKRMKRADGNRYSFLKPLKPAEAGRAVITVATERRWFECVHCGCMRLDRPRELGPLETRGVRNKNAAARAGR